MAQLKDTVVAGSLRVTDTIYGDTIRLTAISAPTSSNGTTYGFGTNGYVIKSNGASVYWAALGGASGYNVTDATAARAIGTGTNLVTERAVYYGLPTINNAHNYTSSTTIYAPTTGGTANYILWGNGATATPIWKAPRDALNYMINQLDTGSSVLTANDYVITQYVGGGTTTTTYHRRPASVLRVGGLLTARKLKVALGSTTDVTFDGTADQTAIPVSGTLPLANGGTGQTSADGVFSALSWSAGTTAGPTLSATIVGKNRTATIPSASASASGIVTTNDQTISGKKTFKYTTRIYPQLGASQERSQWYKITFPYHNAETTSSAKWFMNSFDLHFGGGFSSNAAGMAHVIFYWTRAKENGAWAAAQVSAQMFGIYANKVTLYYRIAEPGILYVYNSSNNYNGVWIDNLYVDDTSPTLDWSTTKIEACAAITDSTSPALSAYTQVPTARLYTENGSVLKTNVNFEGQYIKGTWLYTSAATSISAPAKIAVIHTDNFVYYVTPQNLRNTMGLGNTLSAVPTANGGTGNNTHTANRIVWASSASKLEASGTHYFNGTKLALNSTSAPSENLYVNGTSYTNGTVTISSTGSNRARVNIRSAADVPMDLYLGSNNTDYWSISCRESADPFLGFYSVNSSNWALRCYSNRHVEVPVHAYIGGYNNTSYALSTASFICQSWIRTTGSTGWYNETYGGGWYMNDSTWIKTYNNKSVYMNTGTFRNDGTTQLRKLQHLNTDIAVDGEWITGATGTANSGDGNATQGTLGSSILSIGNAIARPAAGTAGGKDNAEGYLRLYSNSTGYGELTGYSTEARTHIHASTGLSLPENIVGIMFRPGSGSYYTHFSYETAGNEALVMATQNAVTSFIFINGESYANVSSARWQSLTPALQIKQNSVYIGELIQQGATPAYKFKVKGTSAFDGDIQAKIYAGFENGCSTLLCQNALVTTSTLKVGTTTNLTTGDSDGEWLKALLKQICITYPNRTSVIFRGKISPNSEGYYEVCIYSTSDVDTDGIPRYSYGTFRKLSNSYWIFGTSSFSYYCTAIVTNGGTWGIGISGNAATATKLQTTRAINGTNFDGTAAITTATWGTARTLTIGNTSKSVNGSANVSWSKYEILGGSIGSTNLPIYWTGSEFKTCALSLYSYSGALNSNGWATLKGRTNGALISTAYNNAAAAWNCGNYSSSLVFGASDTKGLLDCAYSTPTFAVGGCSIGNSTDAAPNWYMKFSGTSGQTYTLPTSSKTLTATDGSNASGTWGISITGNAASATKLATGRTFQIKDNDATNAGPVSSAFNGEANLVINLPSTIKAALTGNATTSSYPQGFTGRTTASGWGNTTGTHVTGWTYTGGCEIAFLANNPSTGQLSVKIDGRYYCNEGGYWCTYSEVNTQVGSAAQPCYVNSSGRLVAGNTSFPPTAHTHNWLELAPSNKTASTGSAQSDDTGPFNVRWYSESNKIAQQPSQYGFLITCADSKGSSEQHALWLEQCDGHIYHRGTNGANNTSPPAFKKLWQQGDAVTNAVWNDLGECRISSVKDPGFVINPYGEKTTNRLEAGTRIISDTWGFLLGDEKDQKTTPVAIAGRVLAYPYKDKSEYKVGDAVCSAPGGTIDTMTREEIMMYPDRIIGIVNEIPDYDVWLPSAQGGERGPIHTNGRIWIDIK